MWIGQARAGAADLDDAWKPTLTPIQTHRARARLSKKLSSNSPKVPSRGDVKRPLPPPPDDPDRAAEIAFDAFYSDAIETPPAR